METTRLDVRLDDERRRKLREMATRQGVPVSRVVRDLIDRAYEDEQNEARRRAAEELCRLEVGESPEPDALHAALDEAHAVADPYRH